MQKCVVVARDTGIALLAAGLHWEHKPATADAIVDQTARHHGGELLSRDARLRRLKDVTLFARALRTAGSAS